MIWTPDLIAGLRAAWETDKTPMEIGAELGLAAQQVSKKAWALGLPKRPGIASRAQILTNQRRRELVALRAAAIKRSLAAKRALLERTA